MSGDQDTTTYLKLGPAGSRNSGTAWDEKGHNNIVQIFISHDDEINSLQFQYLDNNALVLSETHGSNEGYKFDVVKLTYPTEHITCVSGYKSSNTNHVCSLTIGTNKGQHGPYGQFTDRDKAFQFNLGEGRQFAGFYGSADDNNIKSLGVYLKPITSIDQIVGGTVKPAEEAEKWEVLNGEKD